MYYRCPVCESIVADSLNMVKHLSFHHKISVKTEGILDSYILTLEGYVSLKGNITTDTSQPLMKLVEKE